jgi:hypothetical protein
VDDGVSHGPNCHCLWHRAKRAGQATEAMMKSTSKRVSSVPTGVKPNPMGGGGKKTIRQPVKK